MCIFNFIFKNDVKDIYNCLKSLSKLCQALTALWRKCRLPDFSLLGGISKVYLFLVNRLVLLVCGGQTVHASNVISVCL